MGRRPPSWEEGEPRGTQAKCGGAQEGSELLAPGPLFVINSAAAAGRGDGRVKGQAKAPWETFSLPLPKTDRGRAKRPTCGEVPGRGWH